MSGQVGDGAPADDHDQDGGQGRGAPQGDRSGRGRGSGVVPDPAPPGEPGPPRGLAGPSRIRALDPVRPARHRVRLGEVGHRYGGFFLKLRRIPFRILGPGHLIPVLSGEYLIRSLSEKDGYLSFNTYRQGMWFIRANPSGI